MFRFNFFRLTAVRLTASFLFIGIAGFSGPGAAQAALGASAMGITPHKALYDVKLTSVKSGSQIVNIRGKMYYEWKPSCEGWITNHRFTLNYEYADAAPLSISSDFSTFEDSEGKSIVFSSRRKRGASIYEELRGKAELAQGGTGKAVYTIPQDLDFDLAKGTFFPTSHTLALLDAARKGGKFLNASVFDGSDDDGPVDINAFIGKKIEGNAVTSGQRENIKPASNAAIDKSLIAVPAWNVRMAFFPSGEPDAPSDYELSMVFHDNGIISDMVVDYADFSVKQKLIALEKIKPETCGTP